MTTQLPQNPFPGMNPYLEHPRLWPDVHNSIITALRNYLARRLRPEYRVTTQERVYVLAEPDSNGNGSGGVRVTDVAVLALAGETGASVGHTAPEHGKEAIAVRLPTTELFKERYLEVRTVDREQVIAIIELLSPTNKAGGAGHNEYLAKRVAVLSSATHLVEIDLLRAGRRMPIIGDAPNRHYRILIADARRQEPVGDLYVFDFRGEIPGFVMPLAKDAEGIAVNLNGVVNDVYTDGSFDLGIDYQQDPEPPLSDADRAWLAQLLREQGLRNGGGA